FDVSVLPVRVQRINVKTLEGDRRQKDDTDVPVEDPVTSILSPKANSKSAIGWNRFDTGHSTGEVSRPPEILCLMLLAIVRKCQYRPHAIFQIYENLALAEDQLKATRGH
ncbi:unnamed protein product, partial [Nesidiocoris tenuis]